MRKQSTRSDSSGESITAWADGSCVGNGDPDAVAGFACVIESVEQEEPDELYNSEAFDGPTTCNLAEYMAVLFALARIEQKYSTDRCVDLYTDSELVVRQLRGEYETNEEHLKKIRQETRNFLDEFNGWEVTHKSQSEDSKLRQADKLARMAARGDS